MELKIDHSAQLETPFPMVSLFSEIGSISFRPKSLDYSKAFDQNLYTLITPH